MIFNQFTINILRVIKLPDLITVFRYEPACFLRVSGGDAATFLQGQFSNDLSGMYAGRAVYGLWLDRKGRVVADSHVIASAKEGEFWVASVGSGAATVVRRLQDFIVADDVEIEDQTGDWEGLSLIGEGSGAWLSADPREGHYFPGRRSSGECFEWIYPRDDRPLVDSAVSGALWLSADEVESLRIHCGIPSIPGDIGPGELPNEGGLEDSAVSYSKGCYLGQEVMARLKTRGTIRRGLVRVRGRDPHPASPAALWMDGKRVGELRSSVPQGPGFAGLALVLKASSQSGARLSLSADGPASVEVITGD